MEGSARHIIDDAEYALSAGDVYVVGGETTHGFRAVRDLVLCNIMYYPDMLFSCGGGTRALPGFQALFVLEPQCHKEDCFRHKLQLSPTKRGYVRELIDIMLWEYD